MIKNIVKRILPKESYESIRKTILYGGLGVQCPLCKGSFRKFMKFPYDSTIVDPTCPKCLSISRTRLLWLYLRSKPEFFSKKLKLLHVAPEAKVSSLLKRMPNIDYLSADLFSELAMEKMDIKDIAKPDSSFDVVLCNHVLEHIPDDRKAMRELFRILKPGGWAILQVPMYKEKTYEDFSITTPEGRRAAFGQKDHVRVYGKDYKDRLESVGFSVTVDSFVKTLDSNLIHRCVLDINEDIYLCGK